MTVPRGIAAMTRRVSDMVREMIPRLRHPPMKVDEQQLGVYLRGNAPLYGALVGIINSRIAGRANVPEPSDPLICKSMMARDRELQWLLGRLEYVYQSPVQQAHEDSEPPA